MKPPYSKSSKPAKSSLPPDHSEDLFKYYGRHSCRAISKNRRDEIIRVYITQELIPQFQALLQWCAQNKRAYHVVSKDDLEKITDSVHHEGIAVVAKPYPILNDSDCIKASAKFPDKTLMLFLDGVGNPHNLGALLRTSAHFGVPMIVGEARAVPGLSPSAVRVAEGGAEKVQISVVDKTAAVFEELKKQDYKIISTSSHGERSIYKTRLPKRCIFILGAETVGVSERIEKFADDQVMIPGTGLIESLNVSVAWGLIAGEYWRQHRSSK